MCIKWPRDPLIHFVIDIDTSLGDTACGQAFFHYGPLKTTVEFTNEAPTCLQCLGATPKI